MINFFFKYEQKLVMDAVNNSQHKRKYLIFVTILTHATGHQRRKGEDTKR